MSIRTALVAFVGLIPYNRLKVFALRRLGWAIGDDVKIGVCLFTNTATVQIDHRAIIGHFNVFRNLASLRIGEDAQIGQWNWITASMHMRQSGGPAELSLGAHSAITSRHYIDCTGGVTIGHHTTIAGERSTLITHGISWVTADQTYDSIRIGDYCLVSSNVQITPGTAVGDRIVIGMGSTVSGDLLEEGLYLQPRAALVKKELHGTYFERTHGHISSVRRRS